MAREIVRLSCQERELLTQHYDFYQALASGKRQPTTAAQRDFVRVCQGGIEPTTDHERAWVRFRHLMSLTKMSERNVVENGFRLEVPVGDDETAPNKEVAASPPLPPVDEVDLSEFEEFGEGVPRPGWFTDEGWRRMRAGYRYDSR